MKSTKATKGERRTRRKAKGQRDPGGPMTMPVPGGLLDPALLERMLRATDHTGGVGGWTETASMVLPVLKRVRHPYPPDLAPMYMLVPPGLWTGFGIDFGPAFSHVTAAMLGGWGVDQATLLGTALENLRRRVVDEPPQLQRFTFEGTAVQAIQGQGWGSSLMLLPDVLRATLGPEPRTLLAPVRNTLVALPDDVDLELAVGIWEAVTDGAHDELDVDPMRWTGSAVVAFGDPASGLPN